jgi:hypothetical protein
MTDKRDNLDDLLKEVTDAEEALEYYDVVHFGRLDEHTESIVMIVAHALHRAVGYLTELKGDAEPDAELQREPICPYCERAFTLARPQRYNPSGCTGQCDA